MATKRASTSGNSRTGADKTETAATTELVAATEALTDAVKVLTAMITQLQSAGAAAAAVGAAAAAQINTWEDDPFSETTPTSNPIQAQLISVNTPVNNNPNLPTAIFESQPAASAYNPGTPEFLYWCAAEALNRGINFWSPLLPAGTTWSAETNPLPVKLVTGQQLNAFYDRINGLTFYRAPIGQMTVFSAASPDIVLHELGHGILDAVRPQLWNAASLEIDAFHESFGDMSAILNALQVPSLREKLITDTNGVLNVNSRLSRLAELLGWAIRQQNPTSVDVDCLRNAANRFTYEKPETLPSNAPATQLSSRSHSFSRVFTGAFLDALAAMYTRLGANSADSLLAVSTDMGLLLADAVRTAPVKSGYYAEVAGGMIQSDQARNGGRYGADLTGAFVRRGILSPDSARMVLTAPAPTLTPAPVAAVRGMADFSGPGGAIGSQTLLTYDSDSAGVRDFAAGPEQSSELPTRSIPTSLGMEMQVHVADQSPRLPIAPRSRGVGMFGLEMATSPADEAQSFVEALIQLGRIEYTPAAGVAPVVAEALTIPGAVKTHELVPGPNGPTLLRVRFNCGQCAHDRAD